MIGVLGLQGDFAAHAAALSAQGIEHKLVRLPTDLKDCSGLIIPGGESSALLKLMQPWDFLAAIRKFHESGGAIYGTCAGMILLAKNVRPAQDSLGLIDIDVERNAYGRQIDSKTIYSSKYDKSIFTSEVPITLIRAPRITRAGTAVKTLVWDDETPMLVQQGRILAASFHLEMSNDSLASSEIINHFVSLCSAQP